MTSDPLFTIHGFASGVTAPPPSIPPTTVGNQARERTDQEKATHTGRRDRGGGNTCRDNASRQLRVRVKATVQTDGTHDPQEVRERMVRKDRTKDRPLRVGTQPEGRELAGHPRRLVRVVPDQRGTWPGRVRDRTVGAEDDGAVAQHRDGVAHQPRRQVVGRLGLPLTPVGYPNPAGAP